MSDLSPLGGRHKRIRELVVPAIMVGTIALYVGDSMHLSLEALVLPGILVVVMLAAIAWALASDIMHAQGGPDAEPLPLDDEAGPIIDRRPWLIIVMPAGAMALFDYLGAFVALVALVFLGQAILGTKSPIRSLLIALAVTAPTYAIFKYVLYARFPAGWLGIG